jgi:acyl-CoA thioesterase FadM
MNLYFRLLAVVIGALFKGRCGIEEVFLLDGRVWPFDLDLNLHMTNSRYLALADLGRLDLILRTGAWRAMWRGGVGVVLGGCTVRFRHSLRPFERFTVSTTVLGWDERWVYLRQIFLGEGKPACIAMMRAGFTRKGSLVPPQEIIDAAAGLGKQMVPPAWVAKWNDLEAEYVAEV